MCQRIRRDLHDSDGGGQQQSDLKMKRKAATSTEEKLAHLEYVAIDVLATVGMEKVCSILEPPYF